MTATGSETAERTPAALPEPPDVPADAALFLDFDGTLVDIVADPDAVSPDPALLPLLADLLHRLGGAVCAVSGRPVAQLKHWLPVPGLSYVGQHGAEWEVAGEPPGQVPLPADFRQRLESATTAMQDRHPALRLERKSFSTALHWRERPAEGEAALATVRAAADANGLAVQPGHMVAEAKVPGIDKGRAVQRLLSRPPFAGRRPVAVGDDRTDELMFAALAGMPGAVAVRVGPLPEGGSAAASGLDDPAAVQRWLQRSLEAFRAAGAQDATEGLGS